MIRRFLIFTLLSTQSALAGIQTTLYVAPDGSGSNFSETQPGNLYAARNYIRTIDADMSGDIVVYLYGGVYHLTNSFQLQENATNHDSGTGGFDIIYEAYPGSVPIISGGTVVTNWSLSNAASNIWRAYVGMNVNSRQLYVNGVHAIRARGPLNPGGFTLTSTGFATINAVMQNWGNITNIELVQRNDWKQLRCPIASINGTNIIMQTPAWNYIAPTPTPGPPWNGGGVISMTGVTWVENAYELLTSPGMWYLNQTTGYLYYIPRPGENLTNGSVDLPVLEKLIDAQGGSPATPIHNIIFSGVTFEYGTWLLPSTSAGYADNQAGILWSGPTNSIKTMGNVSFQTASNIQLTNNVFEHLGGAAIDFGGGAHNNIIIGNHIEDVSSDGILLGEVTDFAVTATNRMTDGNVVEDNYIRRIGEDYDDAVGFWGGYARNTLIEHNDIDNISYSGISLGWGWGTYSYAANNQIFGNYVGRVMETLFDGGSCYTMSAQSNSLENCNYYKESGGQGVYWDEGTAYYTGASNVIDNCANDWVWMWTSSIHNNTATNNFSNVGQFNNNGIACVVTNTTYVNGNDWPPAAQSIIQNAGLDPGFRSIELSWTTINDADTNCVYHGAWNYSSGRTFGDYNGDVHSTTNLGDSVDCTFYGTGVGAVCEENSDAGNVDVYLDGVFQATVNCNSGSQLPQQTIFRANGLLARTHTLRLVNDDGQNLVVDAFVVRGTPEIVVDDSEAVFDHVPSDWTYSSSRGDGDYHGDIHYTTTAGQYAQFTFNGMGITWIGEMNNDESNVTVYIDGTNEATVNCYSTTQVTQQRLFTMADLSPGSHTIKLVNVGGGDMVLDAFAVVPDGFTISVPASSQAVVAGGIANWVVKIIDPTGSTNAVTLSVNGLPANSTAVFGPASVDGSGMITLSVSIPANTPPGNYSLTILAISGTLTNSAPVTLAVGSSGLLSLELMNGGALIDPVIHAFSSYYNSGGLVRNVTNLVQNNVVAGESGLSGPGYYTDTHDNGEDDVWHHASGDNNPYVTFDLGTNYNMLITRIWNLNQGQGADNQNGAKDVRISASTNGTTFTILGTNTLAEGPGGPNNEYAQDFATPASGVRYVKVEPLNGYGGGWNGLGAVRFVVAGTRLPLLITGTYPAIHAFSSYYNSGGYVRNVTNLVQSNFVPGEPGLSGPGYATDTHDNGEDDVWHHASGDNDPYVIFDLGSNYDLITTRYWNLNQGLNNDIQNGAKDVRISVSEDGADFSILGTNTLAEGTGTTTEPSQDFFSPAAAIRYVKLEPLDGYGGGWNGLGAVRFAVAGAPSLLSPPPPLITAIVQGTKGFHYQIQANTVLDGSLPWQTVADVPSLPYSPYKVPVLDGLISGTLTQQFYRAAWVP